MGKIAVAIAMPNRAKGNWNNLLLTHKAETLPGGQNLGREANRRSTKVFMGVTARPNAAGIKRSPIFLTAGCL